MTKVFGVLHIVVKVGEDYVVSLTRARLMAYLTGLTPHTKNANEPAGYPIESIANQVLEIIKESTNRVEDTSGMARHPQGERTPDS